MSRRALQHTGAAGVLLLLLTSLPFAAELPGTVVVAAGRSCGGTLGSALPSNFYRSLALQGQIALAQPSPIEAAQASESKTWAGQADFLPGGFENTEIVTGSQAITLDRAWSPNLPIGTGTTPITQDQPILAALGDDTFVAWRRTRSGTTDIVARRLNGPAGPARVNDNTTPAQQSEPTLIARPGGALQAMWNDTRRAGDAGDIYTSSLSSGATTWAANVRVNDDSGTALQRSPDSVVGTVGICSCWFDKRNGHGDIYFSSSTDGASWATNIRLNDDPGAAEQDAPRMAASSEAIHAVWQDMRNGNWDIYSARSDANGVNWQPNVRISDDAGTGAQTSPAIAVAPDGTLLVVWLDERGGAPELYWSRSTDYGQTWSPNRRLATGVQPGTKPAIAADAGGGLYASWAATSAGGDDIVVARSIDGGLSWFLASPVNDIRGSAAPAARTSLVGLSSGRALAAWDDDRPATASQEPGVYSAQWPYSPRAFAPAGVYTGPVLDTRSQAAWGTLRWDASTPANTALAFEVRAGNTAVPDAAWSAWLPVVASGAPLDGVPGGRFFQWRARFSGTNATPQLSSVTLTWEASIRQRSFVPFTIRSE